MTGVQKIKKRQHDEIPDNGTTKDDLLNIIRYLAAKVKEAAR